MKTNFANANKASDDEDHREDIDKKRKKLKKQQKEECGNCCSNFHTCLRRRGREEWPTDRMFRCETFVKLPIKDRAAALEKYQCCSKCTSWHHRVVWSPST